MALTRIFAPIRDSPILIIGLALFGKWVIIYSYLAAVISSSINFWLARKLGRQTVAKPLSSDHLSIAKIFTLTLATGAIMFIIPPIYYYFRRRSKSPPNSSSFHQMS